MYKVTKEQLLAGYIFGDSDNSEYIYLPGGEIGNNNPLCVLERNNSCEDLPIDEAAHMIHRLSLHLCKHPVLGKRSY